MKRESFPRIAVAMLLVSGVATAQKSPTTITWYGHAAFRVVTPNEHVLLFDPWILNPFNKNGPQDLEAINKADLILVSHGQCGRHAHILRRGGEDHPRSGGAQLERQCQRPWRGP